MLTSRRNCSSGSAVQRALAVGGVDAATPPAQSASSIAALRSHLRPPGMSCDSRSGRCLAEHRLGFGQHSAAVVEGFDILDGDRTGDAGLVSGIERDERPGGLPISL